MAEDKLKSLTKSPIAIQWEKGQKCDIFCRLQKKWVDVFKDTEGQWLKVKYGRKTTEIQPDDPDIRSKTTLENIQKIQSALDVIYSNIDLVKPLMQSVSDSHKVEKDKAPDALNWYHVLHCVGQEMYPMMLQSLSLALNDLVNDSRFDIHDFRAETVQRVIDALKTKKVLLSDEITYIRGVVERANIFRWDESESMFLWLFSFPIDFNHSDEYAL